MPLRLKKSTTGSDVLALWKITESWQQLLQLPAARKLNLVELERITHEGNRIQSACARLAAYETFKHKNQASEIIKKNITGKPFIDNARHSVSLSHTEGWSAAYLVKGQFSGLDIQITVPKLVKIAKRVFNEKELEYCNGSIEKTNWIWIAKEVAYKTMGIKGLSLRESINIELSEDSVYTAKAEISMPLQTKILMIHLEKFENILLGYCNKVSTQK